MRLIMLALLLLAGAIPAGAQVVSKSYSYFTVSGRTMEEIEAALNRGGPAVGAGGARHPAATTMQFSTTLAYRHGADACRIEKPVVTLQVRVTLPRWSDRRRADPGVALIWDTLSSDIRRHEEQHVEIAKDYARELQDAIRALPPRRNCDRLKKDVASLTARMLKKHSRAQDRFDVVEGRNFERRLQHLLEKRMRQRSD